MTLQVASKLNKKTIKKLTKSILIILTKFMLKKANEIRSLTLSNEKE